MSLEFIQTGQDFYSADFQLLRNGQTQGQLHLQGQPGTQEGIWTGQLLGHSVMLRPTRIGGVVRPYEITLDGAPAGAVGIVRVRSGLLSRDDSHWLKLGGQEYTMHFVGLGGQGGAYLLCQGNTQTAQIEKEPTVHDRLHRFRIYAPDEHTALVCTLYLCSVYVRGLFRPGEKAVRSVTRSVTFTTNKKQLSRYDPNFKSRHTFL